MGEIASPQLTRGNTTCVKKPHLHAGIEYDKIHAELPTTGELGLENLRVVTGSADYEKPQIQQVLQVG